MPQLRELLAARSSCSYGVNRIVDGLSVDFLHATGIPLGRLHSELEATLRRRETWTVYNPFRPEPRQRNSVLALQFAHLPKVWGQIARSAAIDSQDQARVLICDGPSLLAWVGGLLQEPFTGPGRAPLIALVPALLPMLALP